VFVPIDVTAAPELLDHVGASPVGAGKQKPIWSKST
jgi:hypothetical protein